MLRGHLPFEIFLGLRYLRARGHRANLSLFVWIGIGGVFLGVSALIVDTIFSSDGISPDPSVLGPAVERRLPHGIGVARLFDAPVAWSRQHQMLGLAQ